jgi:UDP-2-acetamido-2-deoxy-ribo-hexuluronate aminotransferase
MLPAPAFIQPSRLAVMEMVSLRVHGQAASGDKYDNVRIRINGRMDTIQAAILLEKLKHYDQELIERNRVADSYTAQLASNIKVPTIAGQQQSVLAQYSIQVNDHPKLQADLQKVGIPTAVFYLFLSTSLLPMKHLGHRVRDFPSSEGVARRIVSLLCTIFGSSQR